MADRQAKGRTRTGNLNGEASPRCRWADAEVARVRELREQGMTLRGIAAHLSMPKSTVASIIAGRHRREVTRVRESL